MKYYLLIGLIGMSSWIYSQSNQLDSLRQLLNESSKDNKEEYLEALFAYGSALSETEIDSAIVVGEEGLSISKAYQLKGNQISFHRLLATALGRKGQFLDAIQHYKTLSELYEETGEGQKAIKSIISVGDLYTRVDPEKSMPYFNQALAALEGAANPSLEASLHTSMGIAFYYMTDFEQSGLYMEKAILFNEEKEDWRKLVSNYNVLGLVRQAEEKFEEAEELYLKALKVAEQNNFNYSKIGIQSNLGNLYVTGRGMLDKGIQFMQQAYESALEAGYQHRAANILFSMSNAYEEMEDQEGAIKVLEESLEIQNELEDAQLKRITLDKLQTLYADIDKYQNAFQYLSELKILDDSLFNAEKQSNLEELETKYQTQEQASKLQLQETQIKEQRSRIIAISLFSILILGITLFIWRNNQEKQKINTQLRELDQAKSRFFANISHELRTPLTLILAPLELAIEKVKSQKALENLGVVRSNSKKLLNLVNEILDLSKLESGRMKLNEKGVDIEKLLRRILFSYHSLAQMKGLILSFNFHLEKDLAISLDVEKFEKVMNNLLSNAFKFSQEGGTITLRVFKEKKNIHIEVEDTGKGIAPKDLEKVFDRFYQVTDESNPMQGGSGIGLAYAREIARLFGGDIKVKSQIDVGSTFQFFFPLKKTSLKSHATFSVVEEVEKGVLTREKPAISLNKRAKILIVEDNIEMSKFLEQILSADYECRVASDGLRALDHLEKEKFDLITSDVMMPNMNGFRLLEELNKKEKRTRTPLILLTARTMEEDKLKAFSLGIDDYLTKPFSTKELLARVQNLLRNKALRAQVVEEESSEENTLPSFEQALLDRARQAVIDNLDNSSFKVPDLSKSLNYSTRQVERILKKLTGLSPGEFIREIRLQKAYALLKSRQFATIAEVRQEVGMEDASHFSRKFQERFGMKPSEVS